MEPSSNYAASSSSSWLLDAIVNSNRRVQGAYWALGRGFQLVGFNITQTASLTRSPAEWFSAARVWSVISDSRRSGDRRRLTADRWGVQKWLHGSASDDRARTARGSAMAGAATTSVTAIDLQNGAYSAANRASGRFHSPNDPTCCVSCSPCCRMTSGRDVMGCVESLEGLPVRWCVFGSPHIFWLRRRRVYSKRLVSRLAYFVRSAVFGMVSTGNIQMLSFDRAVTK